MKSPHSCLSRNEGIHYYLLKWLTVSTYVLGQIHLDYLDCSVEAIFRSFPSFILHTNNLNIQFPWNTFPVCLGSLCYSPSSESHPSLNCILSRNSLFTSQRSGILTSTGSPTCLSTTVVRERRENSWIPTCLRRSWRKGHKHYIILLMHSVS